MKRLVRVIPVLIVGFCLSACTLVEMRQELYYSSSTQPISEQTLKQIRPGITDKNWLLNYLGEANSVEKYDADRLVWRYDLLENRRNSTKVALVYRGTNNRQSRCRLSLLLRNDKVEAMWSGTAPETMAMVAKNLNLAADEEPEVIEACEVFAYAVGAD